MKGLSILAVTLTVMAGCASAPNIRYHTLDMTPASEAPEIPVNVAVDQLRAAQALRRPALMIKRSPTEIEYYAEHEWSADVAELVTEKLAAEFGDPDPKQPTVLVSGNIRAFEQVDTPAGPKPHIKLELTFRMAGTSRYDAPLLEVTYENDYTQTASVAAPGASASQQVGAVVKALTATLEEMAPVIQRDAARAATL
jgi:hypothetical protein